MINSYLVYSVIVIIMGVIIMILGDYADMDAWMSFCVKQ